MSSLVSDSNNSVAQCFRLPNSGATGAITTVAASNASSAALAAGVYRVISDVSVSLAAGPVGHIATTADLQMRANAPEYFYINSGDILCAYDAGIGGGMVSYTRMP